MRSEIIGWKFLGVVGLVLGMAPTAQADDLSDAINRTTDVGRLERVITEAQERIREIEGEAATRRTSSGHIFTRDHSVAALGDAWRYTGTEGHVCDDSEPGCNVIWGDVVRNEDGSVRNMNQYQAVEHCQSIGADLPSRSDFQRLRFYMGASTESYRGYTPQVLPNLYRTFDGRSQSYYFWSSSVRPDVFPYAYDFDGRSGGIYYGHRVNYDYAVRCVRR